MPATDGIVASPGFGRVALAQSAASLAGVSMPSSVVRSMQRIARSSAHRLESFLIDRLAREAARSSAPTWSTLRTPRMSEPRWERESAVATEPIVGGCRLLDSGADSERRPMPEKQVRQRSKIEIGVLTRPSVYWLLLFVPISAGAAGIHQPVAAFLAAAISLAPLAAMSGASTEQLAIHIGPQRGGLLNPTLSNLTELIVGVFLIAAAKFTIGKAAL